MICRGAAEDIISESGRYLNECFPHPESLERHLGAAWKLSEISWGSLQQLLGTTGRSFTESCESLGDFKASPGCLLGAIGRLGGDNYTNLEATWSPKQTQAGDCVLSQNIVKTCIVHMFLQFCFGSVGRDA